MRDSVADANRQTKNRNIMLVPSDGGVGWARRLAGPGAVVDDAGSRGWRQSFLVAPQKRVNGPSGRFATRLFQAARMSYSPSGT